MRSSFLIALFLTFAVSNIALALPSLEHATSNVLLPRGGCSGGVHVCCGSTSVGCSGNVCKACCGQTCGCFYERGGTCSSDPNVTPCVDVNKPDFAMTNGKCVDPKSKSGSSGTSSICSRLPPSLARLYGC